MSTAPSTQSRNWNRIAGVNALLAIASFGAVAGLWRVFVGTGWGQLRDDIAYTGARIGAWRVVDHAYGLLGTISVGAVAVSMAVVVLIATLRRQWLRALLAGIVVAGCNVSTWVLKHLVFTRRHLLAYSNWPDANSLPSGHTTAAASAMVALVLVAAPSWRSLMAFVGSIVMVAFGYATLVGQWHRPSDVIAGYLVCLAWGFAAVSATAIKRARLGSSRTELDVRRPRLRWLPVAMALVGCVLLLPAFAGLLHHYVNVYPPAQSRHVQFFAYACASVSYVAVSLVGMAALAHAVNRLDAPAATASRR